MKRLIDKHLADWKESSFRKPLILGGARQVGKTYAVRELGKTFEFFIEINFEQQEIAQIFEGDLNPERVVRDLIIATQQPIVPGKTLLFLDEVQSVPRALIALRYFYEMMPDLHVIAAGSLIEFAIQQVGVPVGRVSFLYMYPLSFLEFLWAMGHQQLADEIMQQSLLATLSSVVHQHALTLVGHYIALGGMPAVIVAWRKKKDFLACTQIQHDLITAYRRDFDKYAKKNQLPYLNALFNYIPLRLGQKFKFSEVPGEFQKRELAPNLELLVKADVITKVQRSAGNGIPVGAEVDPRDFKVIFLDVGLAQAVLGLNAGPWILNPLEQFVNKGELVEAFVGQELLVYAHPRQKAELYYWQRMARNSQAEIDYIMQKNENVIPIEVKSGLGTTLKSMQMFLESHPKTPYGIRFSVQSYSIFNQIHSYPLYAVAAVVANQQR